MFALELHAGALSKSTVPPPSTPLGPFLDSAVAGATWVTSMGFVGVVAFALFSAGPPARLIGTATLARVTTRLAKVAFGLGVLAVLAVLIDLAHDASETGGFDYGTAWHSLFVGSNGDILSRLEVTFLLLGAVLMLPLASHRIARGASRTWLLSCGLAAGLITLGSTKFPAEVPEHWGSAIFETLVWMMHLIGGAVWLGGLAGLLVVAVPGTIGRAERGAFWGPTIRRFSVTAMICVAAISLSGLYLYWKHVDGPTQLFTTMYGRVLGVKILIFGALLLLGMFNQFWLHPRIEALRSAGDARSLYTILSRRFPAIVAVELLLVIAVLFVAPFLHGSARNQAFQATAAEQADAVAAALTRIPAKSVTTTTWVWGASETIVVILVMVGAYAVSSRVARRRVTAQRLQLGLDAMMRESLTSDGRGAGLGG